MPSGGGVVGAWADRGGVFNQSEGVGMTFSEGALCIFDQGLDYPEGRPLMASATDAGGLGKFIMSYQRSSALSGRRCYHLAAGNKDHP